MIVKPNKQIESESNCKKMRNSKVFNKEGLPNEALSIIRELFEKGYKPSTNHHPDMFIDPLNFDSKSQTRKSCGNTFPLEDFSIATSSTHT